MNRLANPILLIIPPEMLGLWLPLPASWPGGWITAEHDGAGRQLGSYPPDAGSGLGAI